MIPVAKYHGTGNDFVLVEADAPIADRRAFARAVCDRESGLRHPDSSVVGADGVLFCALEETADPPRVAMTLIQPDGSVAAMSGNGARCAARWAADRTGTGTITVDTAAGPRRATIQDEGMVSLEAGTPSFEPAAIPLTGTKPLIEEELEGLTVTAVDTGVPHAVAFVPDVETVDLATVAPPIRHADRFPEGTNVTIASPEADGFAQRTFERGVEGETASCGTGAVAVVAVAVKVGDVDREHPVPVRLPGGTLTVTLQVDGQAILKGPVRYEFDTEVATEGGP